MSIVSEYRQSLKMAEAEEFLDLVIYRPIAFILVKSIYRLPITPNQVTYGSLVAGLISAYECAQGTARGFAFGALWYAIANVLDCADGMLARLQNSGTPLGRLVDGIVDWVSSVAIFFGLGWGMSAYFESPSYWLIAIAAGVVSGYHAMMFDKQQQGYISTVRGEKNFFNRETEKLERELEKSSGLRKFVLHLYSSYMNVQTSKTREAEKPVQHPPDLFRLHNKQAMRWWTWLGPTTNRSVFMIAALVAHPEWFCWFVLLAGNAYLFFMKGWQRRIAVRLALELKTAPIQASKAAA